VVKCPICATLMPVRRDGHPSVVCSVPCAIDFRARKRRAQEGREIDEAVVDRLICGIRVDSVKSERLEATRILDRSGHSAAFIAAQLHVAPQTVRRYRHELLLQEGV
jgi:DNA-binding NarL/FixJ family response regulator